MLLCERLCGREAVMEILDPKGDLTFKNYPHEEDYLLDVREKINRLIENALKHS